MGWWSWRRFFPTLGAGLLDFRTQLLSSPGTLLLARSSSPRRSTPRSSLECPTPNWSAQPQSVPECPAPWGAQPQSLPGVPSLPRKCPNPESPGSAQSLVVSQCQECLERPTPDCFWSAHPRVSPNSLSLHCPTPESAWSAQPQSVPGVPSPRVSWSAQPQSISTKRGWGCSKKKYFLN